MRTLLLLAMIALTGCSYDKNPDTEDDVTFEEHAKAYSGFIKRKREVTVNNEKGLIDNTAGIVTGGVGGVLVASPIGHGAGTVVAEVVGGVIGALGGAEIEQKMKTHQAVEYLVELDDGKLTQVVQNPEPKLFEGQKVCVYIQDDGHARVRLPKKI